MKVSVTLYMAVRIQILIIKNSASTAMRSENYLICIKNFVKNEFLDDHFPVNFRYLFMNSLGSDRRDWVKQTLHKYCYIHKLVLIS